MTSPEAVRIFRAALRLARRMPHEMMGRKMRFNAREMVDFYTQTNHQNGGEQLERGWRALRTMERLLDAEPDRIKELFRPFSLTEPATATEDGGEQKGEPIREH